MGIADTVLSGVPLRSIARDLRKFSVPTADGTEWTPGGMRAQIGVAYAQYCNGASIMSCARHW